MVDSSIGSGSAPPVDLTVDLEKGEDYETLQPELVESLLTPREVEHHELAAASKHLILTEKIIVSLLIVCFVLVEAYFVGHSFRDWLEKQQHVHSNSTNVEEIGTPLSLPVQLLAVGGGKSGSATPEPFEDFDGGLNLDVVAQVIEIVKLPSKQRSLPGQLAVGGGESGSATPEPFENFDERLNLDVVAQVIEIVKLPSEQRSDYGSLHLTTPMNRPPQKTALEQTPNFDG